MAPSTLYSETTVGPLAIFSAAYVSFIPLYVECYRRFSSHAASKTCVVHGHTFVHCCPGYICEGIRIGLVRGRQAQSTALRGNVEPQRRW